jgi:PmbA protein
MTAPNAGALLPVARYALARALHHGARQASVAVDDTRSVDFEWRDGRLEKVQQAQSSTVSVRLFVAGRYSTHQSSDLRESALDPMISQAVAMTRHLSVDAFRSLPDLELCIPPLRQDLEITDPAWESAPRADKIGTADALEQASRGVAGTAEIATVTTGWSDAFSRRILVDSNGLEAYAEGTTFWMGSTVTVKGDGAKRPRGWHWVGARHRADLPPALLVGEEATRRACDRVNTRKVRTGKYAVVVENRSGGQLVGSLLAALDGAAVQQDASFLCGKLGVTFASPVLTIHEEPTVKRGLGSRLFDAEGMAAQRFPLVEGGMLRSYYLDTYYAGKLGMPPTTGGSANLGFALGQRSCDEMLGGLSKGILVTGFLGGNSNRTTGDFSFGILGFYIENGRREYPVAEVNLAGNHLEFWNALREVGNDPYPYSSRYCPSMRFEGVQITGL